MGKSQGQWPPALPSSGRLTSRPLTLLTHAQSYQQSPRGLPSIHEGKQGAQETRPEPPLGIVYASCSLCPDPIWVEPVLPPAGRRRVRGWRTGWHHTSHLRPPSPSPFPGLQDGRAGGEPQTTPAANCLSLALPSRSPPLTTPPRPPGRLCPISPPSPQAPSQGPLAFQHLKEHRDAVCVCLSWRQGAGRLPGWGQLGTGPGGVAGVAHFPAPSLLLCPGWGRRHALGIFPGLLHLPRLLHRFDPPRPLRSSGNRRPALNANGVVGSRLNTHSYPPGSPSGASWNVSANTSKSRGQSPGPNHHPQLLSASAPRPSAIPPPSEARVPAHTHSRHAHVPT